MTSRKSVPEISRSQPYTKERVPISLLTAAILHLTDVMNLCEAVMSVRLSMDAVAAFRFTARA